MHKLPCGASITDRLIGLMRESNENECWEERGYVATFEQHAGFGCAPGDFRWMLMHIPKDSIHADGIVSVAGLKLYLSPTAEDKLGRAVLDWRDGDGVVACEPGPGGA